ncbi:hypothetical protein H4R35_001469 [Dimargaris xerosporica]|nr:hypothetical protein H4R35_001469 [Dimargaris xerosporica]
MRAGFTLLVRLLVLVALWLTLSNAELEYLNQSTGQVIHTYSCYDYEGDISPHYDLTGPLIPISINNGCELALPTRQWDSSFANIAVDGTFLSLLREDIDYNKCVSYGQVMDDYNKLATRLQTLGYPPIRVIIFGANSKSNQHFGSSDEEYYFDYHALKPHNVSFALIGRDTAQYLHSINRLDDPIVVRVIQDEGMWNRDRNSVWNKFRTALAWCTLFPLMIVSVYLVCQSIRMTGKWVNVQIFIFMGAFVFLMGGLVAPISTTQNRFQVFVRYFSWLAGYACYSWVLLSWAVIIKKTQSPRFLKAIWAVTYLGIAGMCFFAILNIVLTAYPTAVSMSLKKWCSLVVIPVVMVLQGALLCFYGMQFLLFIRDSILFANIRLALRKLTVLSLCTFVGFILFAICGTLNQSILHAAPWIMTLRSVLYNTTAFVLVTMIFWVVRIQGSSTFGYRQKGPALPAYAPNRKTFMFPTFASSTPTDPTHPDLPSFASEATLPNLPNSPTSSDAKIDLYADSQVSLATLAAEPTHAAPQPHSTHTTLPSHPAPARSWLRQAWPFSRR